MLPQLGSVAQQAGDWAGRNILADRKGEGRLTWADEFYLRSHDRSAALLDPATIDTPRIHWKGG